MILSGLDDSGSWFTPELLTSLTSGAKDLVATYNTQQILSANTERAKQGLPPLDAAAYAATVNVGLSPELKSMLLIGGLGLLLVYMMTRGRR